VPYLPRCPSGPSRAAAVHRLVQPPTPCVRGSRTQGTIEEAGCLSLLAHHAKLKRKASPAQLVACVTDGRTENMIDTNFY
jgi:hypothetical protein